jgi:uroporphyrinogen decarboxylase
MVHSCGAVEPLLRHFIECGVDILDPVQTTAAGMDPKALKETYGDRLVFHGAIDTQAVLPRGSAEDVKAHVRGMVTELGRDGGYILASCNSIQDDTPTENIMAMYETATDPSWQGGLS